MLQNTAKPFFWPAARCALALGVSALLWVPAASMALPLGANDVQRLVSEGKLPQALKAIDESLAKTPKDAQLQFQRGVVLSMMNRRPEALEAFKKLVAENPTMAPAYNNMAVIYAAMSDYDNAKAALDKAIRISPDYATAYQNLGDVYVQFASQAYQKSIQLDKSDPTVAPKVALLREVLNPGNEKQAAASPAPATAAAPMPAAAPVVATPGATPAATPGVAAKPAAPVAAAKPAEPAGNASADVSATVRAWAAAWSRRDAEAYLAFYAPQYSGTYPKRSTWERERTERISKRSRIQVEVSDLVVSAIGDKAEVRFTQSYESDGPKETSKKVLSLTRSASGQWLIVKEAGA